MDELSHAVASRPGDQPMVSRTPSRARAALAWQVAPVFGPAQDLLYFGAPLALVAVLYALKVYGALSPSAFAVIAALQLVMNASHITSTLYAAHAYAARASAPVRALVAAAPFAILGVEAAAFAWAPRVLMVVLAYWSIFHVARQQFGFVMMARAKAGEPRRTRLYDTLMVLNLVQYPVIHWHAPFSTVPRTYGNAGDMPFVAGATLTQASAALFWVGCALYALSVLREARRGTPPNATKLLILATTGLVYWVGLVAIGDPWLWWLVLGCAHSLPYLGIVHRRAFGATAAPTKRQRLTRWSFLPVCAVLGLAYKNAPAFAQALSPRWQAAAVLVLWWPDLTHYVLDTFLWRRDRRAANPRAAVAGAAASFPLATGRAS